MFKSPHSGHGNDQWGSFNYRVNSWKKMRNRHCGIRSYRIRRNHQLVFGIDRRHIARNRNLLHDRQYISNDDILRGCRQWHLHFNTQNRSDRNHRRRSSFSPDRRNPYPHRNTNRMELEHRCRSNRISMEYNQHLSRRWSSRGGQHAHPNGIDLQYQLHPICMGL